MKAIRTTFKHRGPIQVNTAYFIVQMAEIMYWDYSVYVIHNEVVGAMSLVPHFAVICYCLVFPQKLSRKNLNLSEVEVTK